MSDLVGNPEDRFSRVAAQIYAHPPSVGCVGLLFLELPEILFSTQITLVFYKQ